MQPISHVRPCGISRATKAALTLTRAGAVHARASVARLSTFHKSYPPVYDSRTGFVDYEKEKKNFKLEAPEYFNFANILDEWAQREKDGERDDSIPAFWWVDENGKELKWSFQELTLRGRRVSNLLSGPCGVQRGDCVMVILPRVPEWWLLNIACLRTGSVLSPGSTQLRAKDIESRLVASNATCIIADPVTAELVDQVATSAPHLQTKLLVAENNAERKGWLPYNVLCEQQSTEHECVETRSDEPMTIFFTSGTTGLPKMAEHTHASYGLGHKITGRYWLDVGTEDINWNLSDTGWAKCAWTSLFAPWTQGAGTFVYHRPRFEPKVILETLQKYPISVLCSAPTAFRMMVLENLKHYRFPKLRHCLSAGEPLNPEVTYEWKKGTGLEIREGYGQTETTLLCGSFRCIENRPGSMGKPAPGYDVKVIDNQGNECPANVEGDIAVRVKPERPVGLFTRYVDDPKRTESSYLGDFYLTGDRAIPDKDGYLWFVGRADDVINSAGYRIGPFEVESALIEHPAVAESAVVSSPDTVRGEVVKAFVVLTPGFKGDKDELVRELQQYVKKTTAPYKYPRKIEFVESLPKTVSLKIRRTELRDKEWGRQPSSDTT